jgi:hypothetical protein
MKELEGVLWDEGGSPYAERNNFEGCKTVMCDWLKNDPLGQEFANEFNTAANVAKLSQQLEFHTLPVSSKTLGWVFERLRDSGQLAEPQTAAAPVPDVPRGKDGRPLSSSQLEWRNFAIWANDPKTSSRAIADKRRSSPSFNKFYIESLRQEMNVPIDGAVTPTSGEMRPTTVRGRL